jgi:RNA polymerase sigma-70 factor (ECF subfamily)
VVRDDGMRRAALVVLDRLPPEHRVAFVLHDAFGLPFAEIAEVLGCEVATARQYASRGRRGAPDAEPPPRRSLDEQRAVLERFVAAVSAGDVPAVVRLLHPDVTLVGDGGGKAKTALRSIRGADRVARFLLGLVRKYGLPPHLAGHPVLVNGDLGLVLPSTPGDAEHAPLSHRVTAFTILDGRIAAIYDMANPDKLTRVAH